MAELKTIRDTMHMATVTQLVRIGMTAAGSYFFGDAVANGQEYQGAVGGLVALASFGWWLYGVRKQKVK